MPLTIDKVSEPLSHVKGKLEAMSNKLDLVGVAEIRKMLGVSRQRVDQLIREHPDFPEPVAELSGGRIWLRKDIAAWIKRSGR